MTANQQDLGIDRVSALLKEDSESMSRFLDEVTVRRNAAIDRQKNAYVLYEEELDEIGEFNEKYEIDPDEVVDPNLARIAGQDKHIDYLDDFEEKVDTTSSILQYEKKTKTPNYLKEDKPPVPSMKEKKQMRDKLFDFLDEARMIETKIELELEMAREKGEDQKANSLADEYLKLQKQNFQSVKDMIADYQPNPTMKIWGNDTDYINMVKRLGEISNQEY